MQVTVKGITKKYLLKTALDNVTVEFQSGKIHALVGENGAGKSTLAKILSGDLIMDEGEIILDQKPCVFHQAKDALDQGIVLVHQRPSLADSLTVRENISLKNNRHNFILHSPSQRLLSLQKQWAPELNLNSYVKDLGGNMRFYVSLIGALLREPKCLILDEPSAFLDVAERKKLYTNLHQLVGEGTTVIVITHSKSEASTLADTVTILKEGKLLHHFEDPKEYENFCKDQIFSHEQSAGEKKDSSEIKTCLEIIEAGIKPKKRPALISANLTVSYGHITAVSALQEASLSTLEDLLTGMETNGARGTAVFYDEDHSDSGERLNIKDFTSTWLRKKRTAIVPSDRTYRATNPGLTVEEMLGVYRKSDYEKNALDLIESAGIQIKPEQKVSDLSGGMMQRLILARELSINPSLVILCNPMQGLDIQSQGNLCKRLVELTNMGKAVLILGVQDFPLTLCSRVYELEGGITRLCFDGERQ